MKYAIPVSKAHRSDLHKAWGYEPYENNTGAELISTALNQVKPTIEAAAASDDFEKHRAAAFIINIFRWEDHALKLMGLDLITISNLAQTLASKLAAFINGPTIATWTDADDLRQNMSWQLSCMNRLASTTRATHATHQAEMTAKAVHDSLT